MQINIKFSGISNLIISADLHGLLALSTLSRHYKTLQLAYIWKCFKILYVKGQDNLKYPAVTIDLYRS